MRNAARTRVDAADSWEPNELGGEVHWLRNDEGERPYYAGLWRVTGPLERFPYEFELNETIHVLEGRVEIAVEEGPTLDLGAGDVASFPAGARAVWRVYETPFRELFVLS